jgi:hypothetical protein
MAVDDGLSGPQDFDYLPGQHLGLSERHRHGPLSNRTGHLFWPKLCSGGWAPTAERHEKRAEMAAAAALVNMNSVIKLHTATGVWSRYAGPEPGLIGCRIPSELLAKHGLGPDGRKLAPTAEAIRG